MFRKIFQILIYIFAFIGFILVAGYFAVKFGLTNTRGIIDVQREAFLNSGKTALTANVSQSTGQKNNYWSTLPEWDTVK